MLPAALIWTAASRRRSPPGAGPGAREACVAALAGCALALVMHWPLPLHLGRDVARDVGDPLVQAWQVAWGGHALAHQPLDAFQANTFWPLRNSLAFSEALAGYAPAGLVGDGPHAAIVRYDLLFLFSYALAFTGTFLLSRELDFGAPAAAVAGAAFAYAPWRLEQDGHLHVLSSGGIPLSLFLLVRGYRSGRPATILAAWLVAAWQLTLGFTLGLQLAYLLGALGAVTIGFAMRERRLRLPGRAVLAASALGVVLFAAAGFALARPYLQVAQDHPEARRTAAQVAGLSGPPQSFLAAPEENLIWGKATAGIREGLSSVPEQTLFPGLVIVTLAGLGLGAPVLSRRLRFGLGLGVLALAFLSLGFQEHGVRALFPYRLLFEAAPGWDGIRAPGRLMTLTSLGLALLAGAGTQRVLSVVSQRRPASARAPVAVAAVLAVAVLVEGSGFDLGGGGLRGPSHPAVPPLPTGYPAAPDPQLHLPLTVAANRRYVLWSTNGFPRLVNGRGSFVPRSLERLTYELRNFPDRASADLVRAMGVKLVVLHPNLAHGTPWAGAASRGVKGLGLLRRARGGVVLYGVASPR